MITGILCAIEGEIALLREDMEISQICQAASREFYRGSLYGRETVLALSGIGKVSAAVAATLLIERFHADRVIFCGTAGGADLRLKVGDLVVADHTLQHDVDLIGEPLFYIPGHPGAALATDPVLSARLARAAAEYLEEDMKQDIPAPVRETFGLTAPQVVMGTIASGDQFISSSEKGDWLREHIDNLKCVEMEGAAVGQVCCEFGVPHAIIRVLSDSADESAPVDFDAFANQAARYFTSGAVRRLLMREAQF